MAKTVWMKVTPNVPAIPAVTEDDRQCWARALGIPRHVIDDETLALLNFAYIPTDREKLVLRYERQGAVLIPDDYGKRQHTLCPPYLK